MGYVVVGTQEHLGSQILMDVHLMHDLLSPLTQKIQQKAL
jgi:hypothetical protein